MEDIRFLAKLGSRIKNLRQEKGLSQIALARLCKTAKANMSRIEGGKINVTALTLRKISQALGVKLSDLF